MTAYEIAFGVVLIIVSVLIVVFTLSQPEVCRFVQSTLPAASVAWMPSWPK